MGYDRLDEEELKRINQEYNFTLRVYSEEAYIANGLDEWFIYKTKNGVIYLGHMNKKCNKKRKAHVHTQRTFKNFEDAFESIYTHDKNIKSIVC